MESDYIYCLEATISMEGLQILEDNLIRWCPPITQLVMDRQSAQVQARVATHSAQPRWVLMCTVDNAFETTNKHDLEHWPPLELCTTMASSFTIMSMQTPQRLKGLTQEKGWYGIKIESVIKIFDTITTDVQLAYAGPSKDKDVVATKLSSSSTFVELLPEVSRDRTAGSFWCFRSVCSFQTQLIIRKITSRSLHLYFNSCRFQDVEIRFTISHFLVDSVLVV
jgi:hypothetical protein